MSEPVECKDCHKQVKAGDVFECDTDCKAGPLCEDCYNDNHADGGCKEDVDETPAGPATFDKTELDADTCPFCGDRDLSIGDTTYDNRNVMVYTSCSKDHRWRDDFVLAWRVVNQGDEQSNTPAAYADELLAALETTLEQLTGRGEPEDGDAEVCETARAIITKAKGGA